MMDFLKLPEISGEDFCADIGREDFARRYGNPVIVHTKSGGNLVCMAWEYYERIMQELDRLQDPEGLKKWREELALFSEWFYDLWD